MGRGCVFPSRSYAIHNFWSILTRYLYTYLGHPTRYLKASTTSMGILKSILRGLDQILLMESRKKKNHKAIGLPVLLDFLTSSSLVMPPCWTCFLPHWWETGETAMSFPPLPGASSQTHSQPTCQRQWVHPALTPPAVLLSSYFSPASDKLFGKFCPLLPKKYPCANEGSF